MECSFLSIVQRDIRPGTAYSNLFRTLGLDQTIYLYPTCTYLYHLKLHHSGPKLGLDWSVCPYMMSLAWIWFRDFKRATTHHNSSRGCKVVTFQIWRSEKNRHFGFKATFYKENLNSAWLGLTRLGPQVNPLFLTSNFDRSQFCSPLSYDDER